jgi:hypothetical protein
MNIVAALFPLYVLMERQLMLAQEVGLVNGVVIEMLGLAGLTREKNLHAL